SSRKISLIRSGENSTSDAYFFQGGLPVDFFKDQGYRYIQAMTSDEISTWHEMGIKKRWD
ncbi:hypothetical protein CJF39_17705, partial [Pseudomonas lundensis]